MIIELQKLYPYQGFLIAKARDYQVSKCIEIKHDLHFKFRNRIMTIPYKQLKSRIVDSSEPIQSMFNSGQYYRIIGFRWSPLPVPTAEQEAELFSKQCL